MLKIVAKKLYFAHFLIFFKLSEQFVIKKYFAIDVRWQIVIVILYIVDDLFNLRGFFNMFEYFANNMIKNNILSEFAMFFLYLFLIEVAKHMLGEPVSFEPNTLANLLQILSIIYCGYSIQIKLFFP